MEKPIAYDTFFLMFHERDLQIILKDLCLFAVGFDLGFNFLV